MIDLIKPYLSVLKLAAIVAALATAFGFGWATNGWRLGERLAEKDAEIDRVKLEATVGARAKEQEFNQRLQEAQNAHARREVLLRDDADRARNSSDRLRDELATIRRDLPVLAADACRQRADTLANVLGQCTVEYRSLAEIADRHVNDKRTLMESWPK